MKKPYAVQFARIAILLGSFHSAHGIVAQDRAGSVARPVKVIKNSIGMQLAKIPVGEFRMGNHESAPQLAKDFPEYESERIESLTDELPVHRVRITKAFYLGTCEVTIHQFEQFVEDANYQTEAESDGTGAWGYNPKIAYFEGRKTEYSWRNPGFPQAETHPVVNVTWNDAVAFCKWLSRKENKNYRLPTEAEWEYACRAGTSSRFSSGDDPLSLEGVANLYDVSTRRLFPQWSKFALQANDRHEFTAPVGSFAANPFGLHDMHGNVWEWCSDWYDEEYYARAPLDDPQGPDDGSVRVRRGGSWHSWPFYLRSSFRNWNSADTRYVLVGFRVVREE